MGHCLNLAVQDTCRSIKIMRDAFDTILELSKVFKYSAKKKAMLLKIKAELSPKTPGIKPLCPTRWTVRAESLRSLVLYYEVIQSVLDEILVEYSGNTEATAAARGIVMMKFSFLFGVVVAEIFFSVTDTLSKAIQKKSLCASEARKMAAVTVSSLRDLGSDACFERFWDEIKVKAVDLGVDEPVLPRTRRAPLRLDETTSHTYHDETVEDLYHRHHMEILDKLIGEIERRFESPTFILYSKVEDVLRKAATGEITPTAALGEIITHFGDDLEEAELRTELSMLKNTMQGMSFSIDCFKEKLTPYQTLFPQISKLFRLLLIMPATSVTSERSFSSLRHIKTYLRTSMKQERLNHLRGGWSIFFFRWFCRKKIITNSYFIFFLMFICQNVGNLKGFLLASLHGLYLITLSSYSSTGRGTSSSNKKKNKIK